jgi:hypothetical protein
MAKDTNPTGPTRADWVGDALLVALLPPLVPMLVFMVATTVGGFRNEGENYYMLLLSEIWALALGAVWWGAPNLALTPATLLLRRHAPSLIVGLCYAALIAAIATALVTHFGWLGDPYKWKWSVGMLASAPLFVTSLLAFILAMSAIPVRGGLLVWLFGSDDPAKHLSTAAYLLWLCIGVGLAWWYVADIHENARRYYWSYEIELAEDRDGVPVLRNPLLTWVDELPTSESTENRAWQMSAAASSYRIEIRWWIVVTWVFVPLVVYFFLRRGARQRREDLMGLR